MMIKLCQNLYKKNTQKIERKKNKGQGSKWCKCHQSTKLDVDSLMRRLKRRRWENMGLLLQNMKPCISCDGHKNILNDIMGCNLFPTMGVTEEVDPHGV
jgi:hypothetical protein